MRRIALLVVALTLVLGGATPVLAADQHNRDDGNRGNGNPGLYAPDILHEGLSLTQLAMAWADWAWQPADVNPLLHPRCEHSGIGNIWLLPVSIGGPFELSCTVPRGAKLLVTPGGWECSTAEGNGETVAQLIGCAETNIDLICCVQMLIDGQEVKNVDRWLLTTSGQTLAGPNLFGPDPTLSVERGWFMVLHPMDEGQHEVFIYDAAPSFDLEFSMTFHITVTGD